MPFHSEANLNLKEDTGHSVLFCCYFPMIYKVLVRSRSRCSPVSIRSWSRFGAVLTATLLGARSGISDESKLRLCLPSIILRPGCRSASGVRCQSAGRLMRSGSQGWKTSEISEGWGDVRGGRSYSVCVSDSPGPATRSNNHLIRVGAPESQD